MMNTVKEFLKLTKDRFSDASYKKIKEALRIAISLDTSLRYDSTPFVGHAIGVARIVCEELGMGATSVISAILHDVVRTQSYSLEQVQENFGPECAEVSKGLANISAVETKPSKEQVEHFKELIVSYSTNPRIIIIKLADRLEVMRSLGSFPDDKRAKKSWESLNVYSQLAHKLGLYNVKSEMEDLSLRYLEPDSYSAIENALAATAAERDSFISAFTAPIVEALKVANVNCTIKGRTKSIYSIWRKMHKQNVTFEEVYDVFAIRIVIDCPEPQEKSHCWHTYSIVTDFYKPNPERMRDWISIPKSNGYESLHTTVVTTEGKWVEVQIRSLRMDDVAERGIAAHWRYKGVEGGKLNSEEWLGQLREMMENVEVEGDQMNFNTQLLSGTREIFVFTPTGDLRKLPEGATLLDFAFDIHSNLGARCVGGKVNHKNVSIKEVLHNGDLVEVTTVKNQKPKADWLTFAITGKARSRIKAFIREEEASEARLGREELERKIKNWKLNIGLEESTNILTKHYKAKSTTDIYSMIVGQRVSMAEIKELLQRHLSGENITRHTEERAAPKISKKSDSGDCLIIDERLRDVEYKLARCCNPIFGDLVYGFVTVQSGITIHRNDCVNGSKLKERYPYRVLDAAWGEGRAGGVFSAKVTIESKDVMGLEHSIRDVLKDLNIALRSLNMHYFDGAVISTAVVEVRSITMLDSVIYKLLRVKGVSKVYR